MARPGERGACSPADEWFYQLVLPQLASHGVKGDDAQQRWEALSCSEKRATMLNPFLAPQLLGLSRGLAQATRAVVGAAASVLKVGSIRLPRW